MRTLLNENKNIIKIKQIKSSGIKLKVVVLSFKVKFFFW